MDMEPQHEFDVVVVGGGPAGMMSAGRAAERGLRVLLIEKNDSLGKKLLITGGGRCNVTNAEMDTRTLLQKFKDNDKFLFSVFSQYGVFNVRGSSVERNQFFANLNPATKEVGDTNTPPCQSAEHALCDWSRTPEWNVIREGLTKDAQIIDRVSKETGVSSRMIVAVVVPEQIRFFTANREVFKRYFEPLKILGSLSQFSLGVSGIKQDTALKIEEHIADSNSPFYPGKDLSSLIAYKAGADHDSELYNRLTDSKDHYYSYLYTALFIKQVETQWSRAGFTIAKSPEVITTLFNLGFGASKPNAYPIAGGAPIATGGKTYLYGELGALFYNSDELSTVFPRN